ncbi:integral membrane protein [Botrytis cinerea]
MILDSQHSRVFKSQMGFEARQESPNSNRGLNDRGAQVIIIVAVFWTIATISVVLRLHARRNLYGFGSGDIMLVVFGGSGWHVDQLNPAQLKTAQKVLLANQMLYGVGLGLIKCSITIMLIRIFAVPRFRLAGYFVLAMCISWTVMTILIAFLICHIITDMMILLLPQPIIWRLQMPTANKIALAALMCFGLFTISMSVARVITILNTDFSDFTYNLYNYIWPVIEFGVAIFVCCGPLLRPILTPIIGALASIRTRLESKQDSRRQSSTIKRGGHRGFSQLDEDGLPLRPIAKGTHTNTISATIDTRKNGTGTSGNAGSSDNTAIVVETAWDCA